MLAISIHTFFAEGDSLPPPLQYQLSHFNPHLLCRRWQKNRDLWRKLMRISIHTFFAEGDLSSAIIYLKHQIFQSTPSLQKVTVIVFQSCLATSISIHTFFAEGDLPFAALSMRLRNFNPHLLCRRWPTFIWYISDKSYFNPHLLCRRWR